MIGWLVEWPRADQQRPEAGAGQRVAANVTLRGFPISQPASGGLAGWLVPGRGGGSVWFLMGAFPNSGRSDHVTNRPLSCELDWLTGWQSGDRRASSAREQTPGSVWQPVRHPVIRLSTLADTPRRHHRRPLQEFGPPNKCFVLGTLRAS